MQDKIVYVVDRPNVNGAPGADAAAFRLWLHSVQCTQPFTLEDMTALFHLVKSWKPGDLVDVFDVDGRGRILRVTAGTYRRDIPIT